MNFGGFRGVLGCWLVVYRFGVFWLGVVGGSFVGLSNTCLYGMVVLVGSCVVLYYGWVCVSSVGFCVSSMGVLVCVGCLVGFCDRGSGQRVLCYGSVPVSCLACRLWMYLKMVRVMLVTILLVM